MTKKPRAATRKPRKPAKQMIGSNIEMELDGVVYITVCQRMDEKLYLDEAKKLHAWLTKAIKYLEARKERE